MEKLCSAGATRFEQFAKDVRGNVILTFSLAVPVLLVATLGAVDYSYSVMAKSRMQYFCDSAALKGAAELGVDAGTTTVTRAQTFANNLAEEMRNRWTVTSSAKADANFTTMTIDQYAHRASLFGSILPPGGWNVHASAKATLLTQNRLCVLGLRSGGQQVISLQGSSALNAAGCMIQSNSDLIAAGNSSVQAASVQTVGNASGSISPQPRTGAPSIADPFASMVINVPGTCNDQNMQASSGTYSLNPGVHCGAVSLQGSAKVVLNPGEHYFLNGSVNLSGNAELSGTDAVLIFKGQSQINITGDSAFTLDGRQSGAFAGFVMVGDRSFTGILAISAKAAHRLTGTIYLPKASLAISGSGNKVADQSPWTVVVADTIVESGSPSISINSNYAMSSVPVPAGVGKGVVHLTQ